MSKIVRNFVFKQKLRHKFGHTSTRHVGLLCYENSIYCCNRYCSTIGSIARKRDYVLPEFSTTRRFYSSDDLPSHNKVLLPALSPTMEMGTIISWAKKEGDKLNEGDLLAEIETDKATMGFETPEEGFLAKILVPAGEKDVPIGKLVCIIVESESDIAAFKDYKDDSPPPGKPSEEPAPSTHVSSAPPQPVTITPPVSQSPQNSTTFDKPKDRIFASPLARRLAAEKGLSLASVTKGSGMFGSITSKDLGKASPAGAAPTSSVASTATVGDGYEDRAVSSVRNVIAKRLLQSKQTIPHYYLTVDLNLDEIIKLRTKMNEHLEKSNVKLTINDFIIKATALASKKVPEANSHWMDTFIRQYYSVDVSVAVSTDRGLITPIVFDADKKGLVEISTDIKSLAAKARDGTLQPHEFQGGTISVSNLGMFGIKSVSSIINPPQSCILGIGSAQQRLVPDKSSEKGTKVANIIQMTLSCDHRVVDGAVGAQWLTAFRQLIEEPHNMLL